MRQLLLAVLFWSPLWAYETLHVSRDDTPFSTHSHQLVLKDTAGAFTPQYVLEYEGDSTYHGKDVSYGQNVFWTKLHLKNSDTVPIALMFQNHRPAINLVDVWVFREGKAAVLHELGLFRPASQRDVRTNKSVFYLGLQPEEEVVVLTRMESFGSLNLAWEVLSVNQYTLKNTLEMILWGLFGGVVLALMIYNIAMFASLKERALLFYILHVASAWVYVYGFNGMLHFLGVAEGYVVFILSWVAPFLMAFWFCWFVIDFFDLKTKDRVGYRLFRGVKIVSFSTFVFLCSGFVTQAWLPYAKYALFVGYGLIVAIVVALVWLVWRGHRGAWYFLVGEGVYLASITVTSAALSASVELTTALTFAIPLGLAVEISMLSIALSRKIGYMKTEHQKNILLLMEESKFAAVGKNISEVVHQWKEPISSLASHVVYLESLLHFGKEKEVIKGLKEGLPSMKETLFYLKGALGELYGFFSKKPHLESFAPARQIALALQIQRDRLVLGGVRVEVVCAEELRIVNNQNALANVLMILLDNTLEAFLSHPAEQERFIRIRVFVGKETFYLEYQDNAGGIAVAPPERIFEMGVSTKEKSMGMGLSLAKKLVEERMKGALHVKTLQGTTQFTLTAPA